MGITVLLCGGATAGHIEPALNIAQELTKRKARCEFVGTTRGLDRQLISEAGFRLNLILPVPLPRAISLTAVLFPFRLLVSVVQSVAICRRLKPRAIVGFGSFVALPVYVASWLLRIPLIIHEANAKPGIANQVASRIALRKFQTVENSIPDGETVGTPLRVIYDAFDRDQLRVKGLKEFGLKEERQTLLVFGGSQGARHINDVVNSLSDVLTKKNYQILHIVGKNNSDQISPRTHHVQFEYISDMAKAYAVADLAVCRSGALTVAEIAATNTPAIFVPFPVGNGEQEKNAEARVLIGAAQMLLDENLHADTLLHLIEDVMANLTQMKNAGQMHKPKNATKVIAEAILELETS